MPLPKKSNNQIIVCWCDNGTTDGKFTEGLVYAVLASGLPIASAMRVQGNQIGRQRQQALDYWYNNTDYEWMLSVDSDVVLTTEALNKVWSVAQSGMPIVTGIYFVSKENEQAMMTPYPALFNWTDDPHALSYVHPLPKDIVVKVGAAGFGFVLINRSVVTKMREHHGKNTPFFNETGVGETFVSEDINFYRMMGEAGVPLHAHTGAVVQHIKRFSYDVEYYKAYWDKYSA